MQKQTHDKILKLETQINRVESILLVSVGDIDIGYGLPCYIRAYYFTIKKFIMQLSKHFTLEEMTRSMTAVRKGIDNIPGPGEIKNLGNLCYEVLEPTRAHFDKPLSISSGYRSEALCVAIGSKKTSQHALGCALPILKLIQCPTFKLLTG